MSPRLPPGDAPPDDGALPPPALAELGSRPFGVYVHVPFCASRCGYCDFNTYTAADLGGGASRDGYAAVAIAEIALARRVLGDGAPPVSTVFLGGGTPTLLPPDDLAAILQAAGHAHARAGAPRRAPGARRRHDGRPLRGGGRRARRRRPGLVRDLQLGGVGERALPAQPRVLARRELVGRRPRGAFARRRRAVV